MITLDDWRKAVEDAAVVRIPDQPDVKTTGEIAKMLGISSPTAARRLQTMAERGTAEPAEKVILMRNGSPKRVQAWRLLPPGKRSKRVE